MTITELLQRLAALTPPIELQRAQLRAYCYEMGGEVDGELPPKKYIPARLVRETRGLVWQIDEADLPIIIERLRARPGVGNPAWIKAKE